MKKVLFLQPQTQMVDLAQLVRVPDCGSEGRGFESHIPPQKEKAESLALLFLLLSETVFPNPSLVAAFS